MNGIDALELLSKSKRLPDLILLDVMMPKMSGYEVCHKVRELYPSNLPIIMVSAKNQSEAIADGLRAGNRYLGHSDVLGANDYVSKPFSKLELMARIKTHLK